MNRASLRSYPWCLRHRRGTTLIELLVAIPLAVLAAAAAAMILVRVARTARGQSVILANTSALRHTGLVLAADLAPLDGPDLVVLTDTLLEFKSHLGVLESCAGHGARDVIVAIPAGSDDHWVSSIRAGDDVRHWSATGAPGAVPLAFTRPVAGAPQPVPVAPCGMGSDVVRQWRIPLADSLIPPSTGTPLLVQRAVQYMHYRSGPSWWLGRRSRDGAVWDGLQPVVGPLLSPGSNGVGIRARSAQGTVITASSPLSDSAAAGIAALQIHVRMPRRIAETHALRADSAMLFIPLRASAAGRRAP